jgi:superfamily II DNA helicase RecQ
MYSRQDISKGEYRVLVVQAEQFFIDKGHWPKLARQLNVRDFMKLIKYFLVDEVHSVYTLGMDLYGDTAFRPAWRYLAELRTKLGSKVAVAALSGTLPKHIKKVVKEKLQFDDNQLCSLKLSCNRPNIAYALHEIVKDLSDYRNLDFLLSNETGVLLEGRQRRKGIVFHDSVDGAIAAKVFQDSRLPPERRGRGVIRHYNAQMSAEYLQKVYDDFRDPNGRCEILHATEAASTVRNDALYLAISYSFSRALIFGTSAGLSNMACLAK